MGLLYDVHCHLEHPSIRERIGEIVLNAEKAGLNIIITSGIDRLSNRKALELSGKYPIIEASLGIYPPDALKREIEDAVIGGFISRGDWAGEEFSILDEIEFIRENREKIAAIGEIGLDFKNGSDIQSQKEIFKRMLHLAKKLEKPAIIHSRKAEAEALEMLKESGIRKVILHCFSGKKRLIAEAARLGYIFSVPANVVFSTHFQHLVEMVPLSQLLTETDSPFLSPYKGAHNEPAFVIESARKIAEIKGLDTAEAEKILFTNFRNLFG